MDTLIRDVKIVDPQSPHHNKILTVLIKNGLIASITKDAPKTKHIIDGKGQILTPGWFDLQANFNDPGYEHKEDIASGCQAASHGGFTGVAVLPNTHPTLQTKGGVEYIRSKSQSFLTDLYPIASVTLDAKGEDLTEMIDLHTAGAVAFSDGEKPIWHTDILLKSLIYLQKFDGLLINKSEDQMLTQFGQMNEGITSTALGMKGMPAMAEYFMIKRDLDILEYSGGKIHFSNISTGRSIDIIKKAKKDGLNVTCDVAVHHLLYNETAVEGYLTNFKSNPPFRTEKDRVALIKGVNDGVIDAIVSAHFPQDEEGKKLEFDRAAFGLTGLQTMLPALLQLSGKMSVENWVAKLTFGPRSILGLDQATVKENEQANLTLFDPNKKWTLNEATNQSKSKNTPYFGQELTGKVTAIFNNHKHKNFQ